MSGDIGLPSGRFGSGYEDPKAFEPYNLLLLCLDFIFNWVIDWAHTDPLAVLVIFVFQCLGLIVNLIVYIMAAGSQAMQSGLRKSIIYHHQAYLITSLLYLSLTCYWYIWALRKSWPSVSDQFSFDFGSAEMATTTTTAATAITSLTNLTATTTATPFTSTTSTNAPLILNMTNSSQDFGSKFIRSFPFIRNLFPVRGVKKPGNLPEEIEGIHAREFYTLWSPGFVALYTIQRTVAVIYYFVSLKSTFLVFNAGSIDSFERKGITTSQGDAITHAETGRIPSENTPTDDMHREKEVETDFSLWNPTKTRRNPKMAQTVSNILEVGNTNRKNARN